MVRGKGRWCGPLVRSGAFAAAAASILVLVAPPVSARKARGASGPSLATLMMEKGECGKLIVAGKDFTSECKPYVINNGFSDGRVGFIFGTTSEALMSFNGAAKQIAPDPDTALQPIDRITFTYLKKTENISVVGSCRYTNPYKGKATVTCQAEAPDGTYKGEFLTDGREPINALAK